MRIETKNPGTLTITNTVDPPEAINAELLRTRAVAALAANSTFIGTVTARRTAIGTARTNATTKSTTASVASLANAQTEVRALYGMLAQVGAALDALNDQAEANAKQSNAVIRLMLGQLDAVADT